MSPMESYEHSPQSGSIKKLQCLDPFTYWVQCKSCMDLNVINEKLKHIVNSRHDYSSEPVYTPENGEFVIVQDIDGLFYRASVLSCLKEGYYSVILLDKYGKLTVGEDEIYFLPSPWKYLKEQGHIIRIYGVVPSPQLNMELVRKWERYLTEALSAAISVKLEECCEIEDFSFGSIVLVKGSNVIGLDEILLEQHFAVPSLDFEKDIITSCHHKKTIDSENLHCARTNCTSSITEKYTSTGTLRTSAGSNGITVSPQQALFLKAFTEGFILNPDSLLRPNASNKQHFSGKKSDNSKLQHSVNSESKVKTEKGPDLIFKNHFHNINSANKESIQGLITSFDSPESNFQNYTMSANASSSNITFDGISNDEQYREGSASKKKSESKYADRSSYLDDRSIDARIDNHSEFSNPRHSKHEDHGLNVRHGRDKSSRSRSDNKMNMNYSDRTNLMKNKYSHISIDSSDFSDSSSNYQSNQTNRTGQKETKQSKRGKSNERMSESVPIHQEAKLHLSPDMFLSDEAMYSLDNSSYQVTDRKNVHGDHVRKSFRDRGDLYDSFSPEAQNINKKNSRIPHMERLQPFSSENCRSFGYDSQNSSKNMYSLQNDFHNCVLKEEDDINSTPCNNRRNVDRRSFEMAHSHDHQRHSRIDKSSRENIYSNDRLGNNLQQPYRSKSKGRYGNIDEGGNTEITHSANHQRHRPDELSSENVYYCNERSGNNLKQASRSKSKGSHGNLEGGNAELSHNDYYQRHKTDELSSENLYYYDNRPGSNLKQGYGSRSNSRRGSLDERNTDITHSDNHQRHRIDKSSNENLYSNDRPGMNFKQAYRSKCKGIHGNLDDRNVELSHSEDHERLRTENSSSKNVFSDKPGNNLTQASCRSKSNSRRGSLDKRNTEITHSDDQQRDGTDNLSSESRYSNEGSGNNLKQGRRSKSKSRCGEKTDNEKLSEKFVRHDTTSSVPQNSNSNNINLSWTNLSHECGEFKLSERASQSSQKHPPSKQIDPQQNFMKPTDNENRYLLVSSSEIQNCTSTPKQNFEKESTNEIEISPIYKQHFSEGKCDLLTSVSDTKQSLIGTNSYKNHSSSKGKEEDYEGFNLQKINSDMPVNDENCKKNDSEASNLSLKTEVSHKSFDSLGSKNSILCGGMGRGKLLQIFNKSRSDKHEDSAEQGISANSELFVSCNESHTDLSTKTEDSDEKKCTGERSLPLQSESEVKIDKNEATIANVKHDLPVEESVPCVANDHKDRYFDIEPPKLLTYPIDEASLYATDESKKESPEKSNPEEVYEHLLNDATEHKPLDSSALVNSVPMNTLKLEQEILREYSIGELTERMKFLCGIIHGNIKSQPISNISELKLHDHIFANLAAKKVKDLTRSQMCAIPVLLERRNLILVGPPNSGKTLAYVMSILSLLLDADYYKTIRKGNGPRCVFVTSSSQNANYVSQFCSAMCGAKLTIITTYGGGLELERKVELTNGCEVLVTTPKCWLRLLQHTSVTNLFRLCHIVFDDADRLLDTFLPDVQEIINQTKKMLHIRRRESPLGLHVVVVGEKWTPILEDVLRAVESPVLCISSHLEAALYARVKPTTYILPPGAKVDKLKDLLCYNTQKVRTVIVCQCAAEVKSLRTIIELSVSDDVLVAHEEMSLTLVCEVSAKWARSASPPILLCSDLILGELAVTNTQRLIHFSLPESKAYFSERFATVKENYYDRIKYPKSAPPDCQVDILVDNSNEQQFPEIVELMKRLSTPISEEILATVKKINIQREESKADMMLCKRIVMFGRCWKMERCKKRHVFKKSKDKELPNLPQRGMVKVKILHVHNPSHYSVRIIATKADENDPWEDRKSRFLILGLKMANHYLHRENRIPHGRVNVGDIVGVEVEPDILFTRGRVIDIISRDEKLNPVLVNVHLIDKGSVQKYKAIELLHLPPELQNFEQESYDLYLTGLQPVDFDNEWSFAAIYRLKKSIESLLVNEEDQFFVAKILFTAGTNMIATSLLCYEWLELNKCFIVRFSPRKFILDTGFAEPNNGHVRAILDLAIDGGIISSYPQNFCEVGEEDSNKVEEIQWAHLEKDKYFLTSVISSVHPSLFYLKLNKFSDRLTILQKELTTLLDDKIIKPDVIRLNMLCAVRNPVDNEWNRAMVLEILDNQEIEVFCVDYGDLVTVKFSDFSLLPKGFVTRLPFQAVECSLVGVSPLDGGDWTPEAVQFFYLLAGDEDNVLRPLYAKVCETKPKAETTGGRHYQVILVDTSKDQDTFLNKELVYKGYANWDPITKAHLTDSIHLASNCEDSNDESDEDYVCVDKAQNDNDEETWTDDVCLKSKDEESSNPLVKAKTTNDDKKAVLDNFLKTIMDGDFDFQFTTRGLVEQTFFPQNQFACERGLPSSSNSGTESTLENTAGTEGSLGKEENVEVKGDASESKSLIQARTKSEYDETDSDNLSSFAEDSSCCIPLSKVFDSVYYPPVLWSQTDFYVKLRVNIPDITQYQLDYNEFQLHFQALIEQRYYWFDLKFFGPIYTESVEHSQKGQYFEIKVGKLVKGETWPRLTYEDIKHSWIKLDPEFIFKQGDGADESLAVTLMKRGEKLGKYKEVYSQRQRSNVDSIAALHGPDIDSDLESEDSGSSDAEEFYDIREPEEPEV